MQDDYTTEADVPPAIQNGEACSEPENDLQAQLEGANARADDIYNKLLIAVADLENYRKRVQRDTDARTSAITKRLLNAVLPVLDNLERALSFEDAGIDALRNGVQQTLKGFEAALAAQGVRAISVKGQAFDPKIAEAIGTRAADGVEDDIVLEEAQKGYTIGDELLRPAQVIVSKAPADEL